MPADTDDINSALIGAVKALGGSKKVGAALWPEKTIDAAQRQLLDCLNPERPAHLTPDQVLFVMRLARQAGHHEVMQFLCAELGYSDPTPIEPRDELADLQRQYIEAARSMAAIATRIERVIPFVKAA